jgi:DNA-binding CsgD family transcriptional regulator
MRSRIKSIRAEATNSQVAEIIGITKGTVDSNLYKLKTKWKIMAQNAILN